jgi:hypothetical protein
MSGSFRRLESGTLTGPEGTSIAAMMGSGIARSLEGQWMIQQR